MKTRHLLLLLAAFLALPLLSQATHIKGAYISYKADPQNPLKCNFTFTISSNDLSTVDDPVVIVGMGDGNKLTIPRTKHVPLQNGHSLDIYETEYTYAAPGDYVVYWNGTMNPNIINIPQPSEQISRFVYTQVQVRLTPHNPNSVKTILHAPLEAFTGEPFKMNTIAYEADGHRLVYELVPSKHMVQNAIPLDIPGYQFPAGLYINKFGELHWQNPTVKGEYAISIKITEYKGQQPVGYSVIDLNINVRESRETPKVTLVNKDRLTLNYDGSVYAAPGKLLKLEFYAEKAAGGNPLEKVNQYSDLDTLDLLEPALTVRDSANGFAATVTFTPTIAVARNQAYSIGLRAASLANVNTFQRFAYGWDFVNVYIGTQQPTSSGDLIDNTRIQVYPNPAAGRFVVEGDDLRNAEFKLYNSNGQQVLRKQLNAGSNVLSRPAELAGGVYVFYILSEGSVVKTGKIVF